MGLGIEVGELCVVPESCGEGLDEAGLGWNGLAWMNGTPRKEVLETFSGTRPHLPTGWQRILSWTR